MYPPIFPAVVAHAPALALLDGDPVRLFAFGEAPDNAPKPYAVHQLITGSPENYLAGRPDIDGYTLQVDVYADTGQSARDVAEAIRDAVELKAHIVRWGGESKDGDTGNYRVSFDIAWHAHR